MLEIKDISDNTIVFIHCREPKDIKRLQKELGAKSLLIIRNISEELTNHADLNVYNYTYDYYVINNSTLERLRNDAKLFVKQIKEGVD